MLFLERVLQEMALILCVCEQAQHISLIIAAYQILDHAPYKIRCRDVNDYTGSNCFTDTGCTGECDYPQRCNWALHHWCNDCEQHGLDEECTNEVYDFEDRALKVYIQAQLTRD